MTICLYCCDIVINIDYCVKKYVIWPQEYGFLYKIYKWNILTLIPLSENFKVSSKCVLRMCLGKRGTDLEMVTSKCFVQKYTMLYQACTRRYMIPRIDLEMVGGGSGGSWNCHIKMFCKAVVLWLCYQKICYSKNWLGKGEGGEDLEIVTSKCFVQIILCYQKIYSKNGLEKGGDVLKLSHKNVLYSYTMLPEDFRFQE